MTDREMDNGNLYCPKYAFTAQHKNITHTILFLFVRLANLMNRIKRNIRHIAFNNFNCFMFCK